jgi:hypothetical protein
MKTLSQVLNYRVSLIKTGTAASGKEKNQCRRKLKFLHSVVLCLEHSPKQESIERQLCEAKKNKTRIELEFESTFPSSIDAKTRSNWLKDKGSREINNQIKILSYILGSED